MACIHSNRSLIYFCICAMTKFVFRVGLHEDDPIPGLLCVVEHCTPHSKHKILLKQSPMSTPYPLYGLLDPSDVSEPSQLERSFLTAIIQSQSPNKWAWDSTLPWLHKSQVTVATVICSLLSLSFVSNLPWFINQIKNLCFGCNILDQIKLASSNLAWVSVNAL